MLRQKEGETGATFEIRFGPFGLLFRWMSTAWPEAFNLDGLEDFDKMGFI